MTAKSPSPRLHKSYRAGSSGVRIVWRDGTVTTYPSYALVTFSRVPFRVEGRLYRVSRHLGYEAPALRPA